MMIGELEHMFSNLEKPEEVAERIHEMKKEGYQFLYSDKAKRLIIGEEWPYIEGKEDSPYESIMKKVSEILGISNRKTYEEVDERYNLTMY